jgi:DNA-binding response OmpR family regulator
VKHILIVDDEPAIGHMLSVILQLDGHHVIRVTSDQAAINALRAHRFDVVLADCLPLCADVRREWPRARVILGTRTMSLEPLFGPDDVLLKPYHLADLRRAIQAGPRRSTGHPAHKGSVTLRSAPRSPATARQDCPGRPV